MPIEAIISVVSLLISISTLAGLLYTTGWKLGRLELKVDTIWDFLMRRANAEAFSKGLLAEHSVPQASRELAEAFQPLMPELIRTYVHVRKGCSDAEVLLAIERVFGDQISKEICQKLNVTNGACLVGALQLVKNELKI